jgi:hypothetical protein
MNIDLLFFESNAKWWNDPESGSINQCPYSTGYSRINILEENPQFVNLLPIINKYVTTFDGQESKVSTFEFDIENNSLRGELICQLLGRGVTYEIIGNYARVLSTSGKSYITQRFYLQMACRSLEQAKLIAQSVEDLCFYEIVTPELYFVTYSHDDKISSDCTSRIPVTITCTNGFTCEDTWNFAHRNSSDTSYQELHLKGIPPNVTYLTITSREFVHRDEFPESYISPIHGCKHILPVCADMDGPELTTTILNRIILKLKNARNETNSLSTRYEVEK